MVNLSEHFASDNSNRHSEWLRRRKWFIKAKEIQQRKDELADEADEVALAFAAAIATPIEIQRFEAKLDAYDEGIVIVLMRNAEALERVDQELGVLLDKAHVLEDGRRVFKSEDGSFVVDEHGKSVSHGEISPDAIANERPTAETYLERRDFKQKLEVERAEIFNFQEKVDAARERIADGEISKSELDELDAELADTMPNSVKAVTPGFNTKDNAPNLKSEFAAPSGQSIIDGPSPASIPSASPRI